MRKWLIAVLLIAALVAVVINFAELENFADLLEEAQPFWLFVGLVLQVFTYVFVAAGWAAALGAAGAAPPMRKLVPLSVSKMFADQVVPTAGMSGNVFLVDQLIVEGVPRGAAITALVVSIIGYYISYAVVALIVLALLWLHDKATLLLAGTVSAFMVIAFAIPAGALLLLRRGGELPKSLLRVAAIRHFAEMVREAPVSLTANRLLLFKVSVFNGLVFVVDAATLQVALLALGTTVPFSTSMIALVMASIAVTLGPVPMGLGSFEAVSIAMLRSLAVPLEPAVAGTLLFRGFTLWLPLLPGLYITRQRLRRASQGARTPAS